MGKVFERETNGLKQHLLQIAEIVETQVRTAMQSLVERNPEMAAQVIELDRKVDQEEVLLEEECLKLLALHQPVAHDLRLIIAALKINNDLERIGDLASKIAKCVRNLCTLEPIAVPEKLEEMSKKTKLMFKKSLLSFLELDADFAREAMRADDEIDDLNRSLRSFLAEQIHSNPAKTSQLLLLLDITKAHERIADQASNIAEDVVYLLEGDIVRHGLHRVPADKRPGDISRIK